MRYLLVLVLAPCVCRATSNCVVTDITGCPGSFTSGVHAISGTTPGITCNGSFQFNTTPALSADICWPTGTTTSPVVLLWAGAGAPRTLVCDNPSGANMGTACLILCAERGLMCAAGDMTSYTTAWPRQWQDVRCLINYTLVNAPSANMEGNPKNLTIGGNSLGGLVAITATYVPSGASDSCDTSTQTISPHNVVANDAAYNIARNDILAGSTYANSTATIQGIINTWGSCSSSATCQTWDTNNDVSPIQHLPIITYLSMSAFDNESGSVYNVPIPQNLSEVQSKYGAVTFSQVVLSGTHTGDINNPNGTAYPWFMRSIVAGGNTSSSGTGVAGGY